MKRRLTFQDLFFSFTLQIKFIHFWKWQRRKFFWVFHGRRAKTPIWGWWRTRWTSASRFWKSPKRSFARTPARGFKRSNRCAIGWRKTSTLRMCAQTIPSCWDSCAIKSSACRWPNSSFWNIWIWDESWDICRTTSIFWVRAWKIWSTTVTSCYRRSATSTGDAPCCISQVRFEFKFIASSNDDFCYADGLNGIQFTHADQVKAHWVVYETLMESQEEQILGVVHVGDFHGASTSHVSLWKNPLEFLKLLKWGEQSVPMRHKEIHVYHVSSILKYVVDGGKSIISSKMKERVHVSLNLRFFIRLWSTKLLTLQVHVTSSDMKKQISSVDVLPQEMGGKVPMAEMLELTKMELAASRNTLIALDQMKINNDAGIIGRRNCDKNNNSVSQKSEQVIGSFRKLEIDWAALGEGKISC